MLEDAGFEVAAPALRGHGTRPEDLFGVRYEDWLADARAAWEALPEPKAAVGLSMGGLLAAWLAARGDARALVALAPALGFAHPLSRFAPYLAALRPRTPARSSILDPELRQKSANYRWFPTRAFVELKKLAERTPKVLPQVRARALVVMAEGDRVVPPAAVRRYFDLLGSKDKCLWWLAGSGHDLLQDREAERAARRVLKFLKEAA